jgi:hypothetical protein
MLTGCSSFPKVPDKVLVPVPVSCVKQDAIKPDFISHDELKKLTNPNFVLTITGELLKYEGYTSELETIVKHCK